MRFDCGTTRENPTIDDRYRYIRRGWWLHPANRHIADEIVILSMTRGIPREWLYAVFGWTRLWRKRFRETLHRADHPGYLEQAEFNATTVMSGDGMRMIRLAGPNYAGAAPLWTQLDLRKDGRTDQAIADELGVNRQKVRRWRVNPVFDPLTGEKLRPNRGTPME